MAELRPSGFPEYSPAEQLIFDQLITLISSNYQAFGYTHIHTPAVERNQILLAKNGEETWKQIFGLYGMAQGADDLKDYGLHFDLTVPFARYTLDWEHQLSFPFKRYQIQPVWRGERAQKGRFREFWQCDIDVIWRGEKTYLYYDAEIITTLGKTLLAILRHYQITDTICFHINNKKIIKGFLSDISKDIAQIEAISALIDKCDKIGQDKFLELLQNEQQLSPENCEKILNFLSFCTDQTDQLSTLRTLSQNPDFQEGINELEHVLNLMSQLQTAFNSPFERCIDMKIVRGLDYYTGTIFEASFTQEPQRGSICGGGRYQNLTGYIDPKRQDYCGVWGSIGISRILSKILSSLPSKQKTITDTLILYFEDNKKAIFELAAQLQDQGHKIEIYPEADKLGKQFSYADKKGITQVIIYWRWEYEQHHYKIKNLLTGHEEQINLS